MHKRLRWFPYGKPFLKSDNDFKNSMSSLLEDGLNGKLMDAPKEVTCPRIMFVQGKLMEDRDQVW